MKIKQVEELVGITKKNIRFYEDQGLLNVERAENGYREYHLEDIVRLQEIKLFRKMDISIEDCEISSRKRKACRSAWNSISKNWNTAGKVWRRCRRCASA